MQYKTDMKNVWQHWCAQVRNMYSFNTVGHCPKPALAGSAADVFSSNADTSDDTSYLQCFDTVGWASGRASGPQKLSDEVPADDLHMVQLMPLPPHHLLLH